MPPLFRFNLLLELSRPSNHIDTSTIDEEGDTVYLTPCNRTPPDSNNHNAAKISVRQHPRYSLRIATLIALSLGIVLNTVMLNSYGRQDDTVQILTGTAEWVLVISLLYQLLDLYITRVSNKELPNWVIGTIETLGFLVFGTMFGFNCAATYQMLGVYYRADAAAVLAYNSAIWVVCLIIHAIITIQCIILWSRRRNLTHANCPHCKRTQSTNAKANVRDVGDEEEALISAEGEAGPERSLGKYRDEEVEDSSAHS